MNFPALLSFFCGFISLSLEILWVRLYGFSMLSTPIAFGFVLMAYLFGIAIGAWQGGKICRRTPSNLLLWRRSIAALAASAVLTLTVPAVFAWGHNQWWSNPLIDFVLIALVSCVLAYVFPIAHHLGAGPGTKKQGQRFAWVYTSNVMGAALGPLVTGYVLLNFYSLQQAFVAMVLLQLFAVGFFYWTQKIGVLRNLVLTGSVSVAGIVLFLSTSVEPHAIIQKINNNNQIASHIIENKHGIITIFPADEKIYIKGDDAVYGGNVYDGRTNLSMEKNTNGLHRPLLLAALQPQPKKVLMVGLSIGSWLALVNGFPGVEHIDVVEINAGYLQAAEAYPAQAKALRDPRVNIVIDDARRWLRLHPEKTYDVIIMNTTWHWRANAGFLLSQEFLQLIQKHMAPGAVMAFNATGSPDAFYTAVHIFDHVYRYENFIYAASFDFRSRKDSDEARKTYSNVKIEDKKIFSDGDLINHYLGKRFVSIEQDVNNSKRPLEVITDNNGLTEFKYGYSLNRLY